MKYMIQFIHQKAHAGIILGFWLMVAVIQAYLIAKSAYMAIILSMAALFFMLFHNAPVGLLIILLFMFPFSGTAVFKAALADLPGVKPLQIFSLAIMSVAVLNMRHAIRLPRSAAVFFGVIVAVFTLAFMRALPNLAYINQMLPEPLSITRFFLSEYLKPLIYFIPAVIMIQYVYTTRDIERVASVINWSITLLSVVLVALFMFNRNLILDPKSTRDYYASSFGLHTNSIVNYYIIGFPFVLTDLFRKRVLLGIAKILLCATGIALLFSRSAYFLLILSFFIYLFLANRARWLPLVGAAMLAGILVLPGSVIERATKGFHSSNRNDFTAGRVDHIWLPLIHEAVSDPKTLLLGNGRYAMVSTHAHKTHQVLQAMHPHNMYLEMVLDAGLVGLTIVLSLFFFLLKKTYSSLRRVSGGAIKEYQIATLTSLICFLISGLTDRTFFPDEINGYLWMIAAMSFILSRHLAGEQSFLPQEQGEAPHPSGQVNVSDR